MTETPRRISSSKKRPKKVPTPCYIHDEADKITTCKVCKKPICRRCSSFSYYPHVCPFCFPKDYKKKKKRYRKKLKKWLIVLAFVTLGIFLLMIIVPTIMELPKELEEEEPEPYIQPEPKVSLDKNQIFPVLLRDTYNPVTGKVGMTFKIYVTNVYREPVTEVKIELLILRNLTIREEQMQTLGTIAPQTTEVIWFNDVNVRPGTYYAHFILWQKGKVTGKVDIYFVVNRDDVLETTPPPSKTEDADGDGFSDYDEWSAGTDPTDPYDSPETSQGDYADDDDEDKAGFPTMITAGCLVAIMVIIIIVIVVAVFLSSQHQRKTKLQGKRKQVLEYVRDHPGANLNKIKNETDSGAGSVKYNLDKLKEDQMVYSKEDGQYKRFYDSSVPFSQTPEAEASTRARIYSLIKENPGGVTSTEIMEKLDLSKQVVFYNIHLLMEEKKVTSQEVDGRLLFGIRPEEEKTEEEEVTE